MKFFYGPEADMFTFFKIPKLLFSPPYKHISTDAKLLYGLMLDRMGLSAKSERWVDPDGRVFIYFPIAEVMELLDIANQKASGLYKELESVELIQRKRQGLGKPTKIYVSKFFRTAQEEDAPEEAAAAPNPEPAAPVLIPEKSESGIMKNMNQEAWKSGIPPFNKKTDILYTENQSDLSINEGAESPKVDQNPEPASGVAELESQVRKQIEYDTLLLRRPWDSSGLENIVHLIADTCTTRKKSIRIGGEPRKSEEVKRRLLSLTLEDVEAVLEAVFNPESEDIPGKVRNMRAYLLTALYNAPGTSEAYSANATRYGDMP